MRVALAQMNPTVGGLDANASAIAGWIERAREAGADAVVLPELALSGYPPRDLVLQEGFVERCRVLSLELARAARGITAIFGTPLPGTGLETPHAVGAPIHNALVAARDSARVVHAKRLLPTYDVFDEDRYFQAGSRAVVIDVPGVSGSVRVGLSICEDLWRGDDVGAAARYRARPDPVAELIAAGARVIVNPSASPFALGKGRAQRAILAGHAARHGVHVLGVNQVGGNDELIFDGHAAAYDPQGRLIAAGPGFAEALTLVDLGAPAAAIDDPLLLSSDDALTFRALVLGVRDYLRKTGFTSALLGISGGVDSALVATLAASALGPDRVTGLIMPGPYSSSHARDDALELAGRLGIRAVTIPIEDALRGHRGALDPAFVDAGFSALGATLPDFAEENLQSRIRGAIVMAWSNRTGAIVLTTGNKSELAVGYCTLYGDMNGGLAVLSDLTKRAVYGLSRWINAEHASLGWTRPPIPERSITKAPSAELRPGQTDQDDLPPYDAVDEIVRRFVEGRESPERIAWESGITPSVVARIVGMIQRNEYKRRQLTTGLKITPVAFGVGRRWPIAQAWKPA